MGLIIGPQFREWAVVNGTEHMVRCWEDGACVFACGCRAPRSGLEDLGWARSVLEVTMCGRCGQPKERRPGGKAGWPEAL